MIVFDNETTGLLKPSLTDISEQPYITEICCVKINFDQNSGEYDFVDEMETLVKPGMPIPEDLEEKIGITNEMVEGAPPFIEIYDHLCDFFLGEQTFVAHNLSFDAGCVKYELMRHGLEFKFPWPKNWLCTVEATRHLENKRLRLGYLHELATGKQLEGWHRAKNDVYGLIRILNWMVDQKIINPEAYP